MKVKDLIENLKRQDPESEIVMKNLYANPIEPGYVLTKIRTYKWDDKVFIDGHGKVPSKR